MIDKVLLASKTELIIYYTHRPPVTVSGEDAYSLFLYLQTPTELKFNEFTAAISSELENTAIAA